MNFKRVIIVIIVLGVLVGGGYFAYRAVAAPGPANDVPVTVAGAVTIDTGLDLVSAEGQIVPLRQAGLSFQIGGPVAEIFVVEGTAVAAGDRLLRLHAPDLAIGLQQAEAALIQAQAGLQAAEAQQLAAEAGITTARAGVTAAEAQLALSKAGPSPEEIAAAASNLAAAEAGISQAAANRDVRLTGATLSQIQAAEANVAAAMAEERALQEQYDNLIRNDILGTVEEHTRIALNAAKARLASAQAALNELQAGATGAEQRAATASVTGATAQRDAAQAQLDLLLAGAKAEQIALAEVGVLQAEAAVAQAEVSVVQANAAVTQAEAGVLQAQAAVDAARAALDKATLLAPFDGVAAAISVELGEVVAPGAPVLTLADFSRWQVETTDLSELDVVAVGNGYPVRIRIDAIPGEILQGTVTDIASVSQLSRGDVTYVVTVDLDDDGRLPLRWGMTVFVDIDVKQ